MSDTTRIFTVGKEGARAPAVQEAAALVAAGGLVAFPTETVYGIAVNADDPAAVERLFEVKGRPPGKPFTVHIADVENLAGVVPSVPYTGRKLIDKFWPGPLTIIFGQGSEAVGVRFPAHDVARAFLRATGVHVVAPSANLSGQPPASTAAEVLAVFDGKIEGVLDGGNAPLRQASTIVRVWSNGWEMIREGIITQDNLARALKLNVLFLCTGNSCRSPLAEALFRRTAAEKTGVAEKDLPAVGCTVSSAGTATTDGLRASQSAREAGRNVGLDLTSHRTRSLTAEMLREADKIYALAQSHADAARGLFPAARKKIELLDPSGRDIEDPIGWPPEMFARVVEQIRKAIDKRVEQLL